MKRMITVRDKVWICVWILLMGWAMASNISCLNRWVFGIGLFFLGACELHRRNDHA